MFSRRSIVDFQGVIRNKLDLLCEKIAQYKAIGRTFSLLDAWTCFAGDVITEYCFGTSYDHLQSPNFKENFHETLMAVSEAGHLTLQFPWIHPLMRAMPDWFVSKTRPLLRLLKVFQRVSATRGKLRQ